MNQNPLDALYSWQTALLAIVIVGLTQSFKAGLDSVLVFRGRNSDVSKTGKELRAEIRTVNSILLPLFPIVLGALIGSLVPVRPDQLVSYVKLHAEGSITPYALWGAAVGQFSDYLYTRVKNLFPKTAITPPTSSVPSAPVSPVSPDPISTESTVTLTPDAPTQQDEDVQPVETPKS